MHMALQSLSPEESLAVVRSVWGTGDNSELLGQAIVKRAEGDPFFLEELVRAVADHGDLGTTEAIPDTIHGILMARIDRLPSEERHLVQC